jgi:hypothetical protein
MPIKPFPYQASEAELDQAWEIFKNQWIIFEGADNDDNRYQGKLLSIINSRKSTNYYI